MAYTPPNITTTNFELVEYTPPAINAANFSLNDPPSVALNSPADTSSTSDTTPVLDFTGTDGDGDSIRYQVQISDRYASAPVFKHKNSSGALLNTSSFSISNVVVDAGDDRYLLVSVHTRDASTSVSSVARNGQSFTLIDSVQETDWTTYARTEFWGLKAPNIGTYDVDITLSAASDVANAVVTDWTGVNQITPINTSNKGEGTSTSGVAVSLSVTTTVPNCVLVGGVYSKAAPATFTDNVSQTELYKTSVNSGGDTACTSYKAATTQGANSMQYVDTEAADYAYMVVALAPITPPNTFGVLADDNFDRTNSSSIGSSWTEGAGGWEIVSNELKLTSYSGTGIANFWDYVTYDTALGTADYTVEATVRSPSDSGELSIGARFTNEDNYYGFEIVPGDNLWQVFKVVGGSQTNFDSDTITLSGSTDYVLKLSVIGTTIRAYINGNQVYETTDSSLSSAGKPILATDTANVTFDDFKVYDSTGILINTFSGQAIDYSDNFDDNSLDAKWTSYTASSGAVSETSQQLSITCANSTNGSWAGIVSDTAIDFTGRYVQMHYIDATGGNTYFDLSLNVQQIPSTGVAYISIGVNTGTGMLEAYKKINNVDTVLADEIFNSTNHQYVRLRESGGTMYWEYSADNSTWTELYSEPNPIDVTALYVTVDDYEYNALGTPGAHIIDDLIVAVYQSSAFVNPDTGADTDPFNSGENIQYTVQSALELGTYYWRVRGIDPSGSNTWGSWATTRSFEITAGAGTSIKDMIGMGMIAFPR